MSDIHDQYLSGVNDLLVVMRSSDTETRLNLLALQGRLAGSIANIRRFGPADDFQVEIARVLTELNRLCLQYLGISFFDFSKTTGVTEVSHAEVAQNLPQRWYGQLVGREEELAQVFRLLSPSSRHFLVTIDGIGGIGKSALALEAAYHYWDNALDLPELERFQAIIWISAKESILTADGLVRRLPVLRTLDDIYAAIAVTLRREDITRARLDQQHEVVRNTLTRQRVLLIVDNLETIEDEAVISFLRELPPPTKAIVTTRHRIDIAYPVRLLGMSWYSGQHLIVQECERKGVKLSTDQVKILFERTGGIPLALEWSIAQVGFGNSVDSVLLQLGNPRGDVARYCFDASMACVRGTDAHKLMMVLVFFPAGTDRKALGYVAGINDDSASLDGGLAQLEKLSLVNRQGGKFTMLPLTRSYCFHELDNSGGFADHAKLRWVEYLAELLPSQSCRYWIQDQITILNEGENFRSLAEWATSRDDHETLLKVIRPAILSLQYSGRRTEALKLALSVVQTAGELGDKSASAWLHIDAGWILSQQGVHELALEQTNAGLADYEQLGDEIGICFARCFLAQAQRHAGQLGEADISLKAAASLASRLDYLEGVALSGFELGKLARDRGDWNGAYFYLKTASDALSELGDLFTDITSLAIQGNFGDAALKLGRHAEAREVTSKVLAILERWRTFGLASNFTARMHLQMAEIEEVLGLRDSALSHAETALQLSHTTRDEKGLTRAERFVMRLQTSTG